MITVTKYKQPKTTTLSKGQYKGTLTKITPLIIYDIREHRSGGGYQFEAEINGETYTKTVPSVISNSSVFLRLLKGITGFKDSAQVIELIKKTGYLLDTKSFINKQYYFQIKKIHAGGKEYSEIEKISLSKNA
jgi:hypothetical protein